MIKRSKPLKRSRVKPRKKTVSARRMILALDKACREEVFERDGHKCVLCPNTESIAPSHVYPKGKYPRLRFMTINVLTMCYFHHIHWWHKNPIEATEWFLKTYSDRAAQLRMLRDTAPKLDLREMYEALSAVPQPRSEDFGTEPWS